VVEGFPSKHEALSSNPSTLPSIDVWRCKLPGKIKRKYLMLYFYLFLIGKKGKERNQYILTVEIRISKLIFY
jgi:hypothetical protein